MEANKVKRQPPTAHGQRHGKGRVYPCRQTALKIVEQPTLNGVMLRIPWNNETLRQDHGRDYLIPMPKYDGFCTVPNTSAIGP